MQLYWLLLQIFLTPLNSPNKDNHKYFSYWERYVFALDQIVFAFADQNQ